MSTDELHNLHDFQQQLWFPLQEPAQQCVQADLVVRAAKEPPSRRKHFSVSLADPPTKPLTRAVGRTAFL